MICYRDLRYNSIKISNLSTAEGASNVAKFLEIMKFTGRLCICKTVFRMKLPSSSNVRIPVKVYGLDSYSITRFTEAKKTLEKQVQCKLRFSFMLYSGFTAFVPPKNKRVLRMFGRRRYRPFEMLLKSNREPFYPFWESRELTVNTCIYYSDNKAVKRSE